MVHTYEYTYYKTVEDNQGSTLVVTDYFKGIENVTQYTYTYDEITGSRIDTKSELLTQRPASDRILTRTYEWVEE